MIHKFIAGIIFCLLIADIQAQTQGEKWTVTGKVLEQQTGEAVEYANVLLYSVSDSALASHSTTAAGGVFTLEHSKAGEYYLEIGSVGYEKKRVALPRFVASQKNIILGDIRIAESHLELSAVEVVGQKRKIVYKLDKRVIEASGFL